MIDTVTLWVWRVSLAILILTFILIAATFNYGCGSAVAIELANPQIETPEALSAMRSLLPTLSDSKADRRLHDDRVVWYTLESIGIAYQAHSGDQPGTGPIGFADAEAPGRPNQNTRFPWQPMPGGTHRAIGTDSFKGFLLPMDERGKPRPVVWYRHKLEGLADPDKTVLGWSWTFPVGTIIWEVLTVEHAGEAYAYEVRSRWRYGDHWRPRVYRPFPKATDAAAAVLARPRTTQGAAFVEFCYQPVLATASIQSRSQGNPAFGTGPGDAFRLLNFGYDVLPELPVRLVADMLDSTPFQEVDGIQWKPGASSPVNSHGFHIVPYRSLLPIVGGDEATCAKCHESSLTSSRRFAKNRKRWGWVRGNLGTLESGGGILSWHPIEPAVFRGRSRANPAVRMRTKWTATGLINKHNTRTHSSRYYRRLVPQNLEKL